jgi:D-sedoheptulose 7-phosphate isomerase
MNYTFFENIKHNLYEVEEKHSSNIDSIKKHILSARYDNGRVFIFGNGGSAAIAEHIATDFNKRCGVNTLTLSNVSLLTCYSNDFGYDQVFVSFLKNSKINYADVAILISSSGKSQNILNAIDFCNNRIIKSVNLICGFDGHDESSIVRSKLSNYIHIDSYNYGEVEIVSEIILHSIVEEMVEESKMK